MSAAPNSKLIASAAVLLVKDVVAAANHYRDAMGFAYDRFYGEPQSFVILGRGIIRVLVEYWWLFCVYAPRGVLLPAMNLIRAH